MVSRMKRLHRCIGALALALSLVLTGSQSALAVTTDSLNNKSDGTVSIDKVDSAKNKGSFTVSCAGTQDEVKIFQAATMTWNDSNNSFDAPEWVPEVQSWLASYTDGSGTIFAAYDTPAKLAAQSETTQGEFFKAIVGDKGIAESGWTYKWSSDSSTGYADTNVVVENQDASSNIESYTITNVPIGIYIAVGYNSNKIYTPAVANLIPQRDPTGTWYLNQDISVSMKAANVYMHKYINGKKTDIVTIGEDVDFSIDFPLPQYAERTMDGNAKEYTLTFDDELADSFTLDMNSIVVKYRTSDGVDWKDIGYGSGQNTEIKDTDGSTVIGGIFDTKYYSSFIAAPAASASDYGMTVWGCSYGHLNQYTIYRNCYKYYNSSGTLNDNDGKGSYDKYYAYYYYRDGAYHLLENPTQKSYPELSGSSTMISVPKTPSTTVLSGNEVRALYSNKTGDTVNHGWSMYTADGLANGSTSGADTTYPALGGMTGREYVKSLFHNIFNITFNYGELIKAGLSDKNLELQITYKAQVNQRVTVGTETNTNTAIMKYETNSTGTNIGTISDTVKAYTYGLNLVKVDGDTVDGSNPTYLAGAKFRIFKETDTFVGSSESDDTTSKYKGSMAGSDTSGLDVDTTTLSEYKASHTGDDTYYYYTYKAESEAILDNGVNITTGDVVTRVFKLLTLEDKTYGISLDGTITSVGTAEGVKINGLDVGNYVVSEYQAPDGYNTLAEDMMFSIYELSETAAETKGGSYALFANDSSSTDIDDDGMYSLQVLNYAGLTLPSTGGIGTLIFTVVGMLLMLLAILVIIRKGRKHVNKAIGMMSILLVAGILLITNPQNAKAYTEVSLNNEFGTLTTGDNQINFNVELKNKGDRIEAYQIGTLTWNADKNTYEGPNWVLGVSDSVALNNTFKTYDTPEKLGAADTKIQIAFLNWLYENKDSNNLTNSSKVADSNISYSSDEMTATVKGVPYGIYLIKASNPTTGKNYQLLTVDAMPTKEGPLGAWYVKDNITASLKFSDIAVDKKINGQDGITVTTGQNVKFDIVGEVPDYPGVDVPGSDEKDYSGYTFYLNDTMSQAFDYDMTSGVTIEYTTDNVSWTAVPSEPSDSNERCIDVFAKAAPDTNVTSEGIRAYKDAAGNEIIYLNVSKMNDSSGKYEVSWFAYIESTNRYERIYHVWNLSESELQKHSASSVTTTTGSYVSEMFTAYKKATGNTTTSFTRLPIEKWKPIMFIDFDYEYLHQLGATHVRVSYNATVTSSAVVGTDDNTNTATFTYQKDLSGEPGSSSDTAYAWTYAMNLVKKDGDNAGTYLAGAKFKLYKEAYEYVPTDAGADKLSGTYDKYTFKANADGTTTVPTGITSTEADAVAVDLTSLDLVNSVQGGDYYYRYVDYAAGKCAYDDCPMHGAEHSHVIVYGLYTYKDATGKDEKLITSVANSNGVTITGLSPASYVLIETEAPSGYNKLQEALRFDITELTAEQAKTLTLSTPDGKDSLKGFASDETYSQEQIDADSSLKYITVNEGGQDKYYKAYTDGIYPIEVENYAGLTLPSTGGMGTLLFTVIGILLMTAVLVVLFVKRKGAQYANY